MMKLQLKTAAMILLLVMLISSTTFGYDIFVWQHDNRLRVNDTVLNASLTATQAVTRTLDELEVEYDISQQLPDDLLEYEVVIVCLSFYCPG